MKVFGQVIVSQLYTKFASHHRTAYFNTVFAGSNHWSLSRAIWTHSTPIPILYSYISLDLAGDVFPSGFSTRTLHEPLSFSRRATCCHASFPAWFDHPDNIWRGLNCTEDLITKWLVSSCCFLLVPDTLLQCLAIWRYPDMKHGVIMIKTGS